MTELPIVVNPAAGGGRLMRHRLALDRVAHARGVRLGWLATERPRHGEELARRAVDDGHRLVLAFGGDGTYNEVASGLIGTPAALGVIPGGTTSVLAYEFAIPRSPSRALEALLDGRDRPMRVCRTDRGMLVVLMLSAGPDAIVVADVPYLFKSRAGRAGVLVQAVRELVRRRPLPDFRVTLDGESWTCGWAIVGNSRCYAGPYHATPGADPFGAGFQLVVQRGVGRAAALGFALGIPVGRHLRRSDVLYRHGSSVRLEAIDPSARVPYQVDGEAAGLLPVEVTSEERELQVRLPADADLGRSARVDPRGAH